MGGRLGYVQLCQGLSCAACSREDDEEDERDGIEQLTAKDVAQLCPDDEDADIAQQVGRGDPRSAVKATKVIGNGGHRSRHNGNFNVCQEQGDDETRAEPVSVSMCKGSCLGAKQGDG